MSSNGAATAAAPAATPATGEKVAKKSDKEVDLVNASRGVWLVKVPKYIADRWESAPDASQVGKLRITRRANMKPAVSFSLDDSVIAAKPGPSGKDAPVDKRATTKQIPKEHKFVVNTVQAQTLAAFSCTAADPPADEKEKPTGDKLCLEGKVVQRAECRPISDSTYMSLKKEAIMKAIEPARKTVQIDRAVMAYKPKSNHQSNIAYDLKKKSDGKKARDDKEKVMEVLFALFEKHQYYKINDLVKETRQPVTYLKEILKEVCIYNVKNPHKSMWELKPEFRHYKKEETEEKKEEQDSSSDDD